jgi:hypothetical protein
MADVNTQIYQPLQAPQQQPMTPLSVLQMIGQINTNRLFDQEYSARQNIGQAYHDNTLPGGNINEPGLRTQIGQTGGFRAGEGLQQANANSSSDVDLKSKHQQIMRHNFGALAAKPNVTDADIAQAAVASSAQGVPGQVVQDYAATMPREKDAAKRKEWLVTQQNLAQSPETIARGTEGPIDNSGVRPQISEGQAGYQRVAPSPGGVGMRTTLPIGSGAALERSAADITALRSKNTSYPNDMVAIGGLIHSLKAVGDKGSGPGTSELNTLKSALYSNFSWVPGVEKAVGDPQVMADYASGEKYAKQLATSLADNIGPGTNQGLTTAFGSSPNMNISNLAGTQLAKTLYGIRNMQQAMQIAFDKTGLPENQFHRWARENWSTKVNPAGMMWDQLDEKEQDRVLKRIDENPKTARAERAKLNASIHQAVSSGLMADPFAKAGQ